MLQADLAAFTPGQCVRIELSAPLVARRDDDVVCEVTPVYVVFMGVCDDRIVFEFFAPGGWTRFRVPCSLVRAVQALDRGVETALREAFDSRLWDSFPVACPDGIDA